MNARLLGGSWGILPQKILKSRGSEINILPEICLKKHSTWILLGTSSAYSNIMEFLKT